MTQDEMLTPVECDLAEMAGRLATAVDWHLGNDYWTEGIIPPESDGDVLASNLNTPLGDPAPAAGFTLWHGDVAYRVQLTRKA